MLPLPLPSLNIPTSIHMNLIVDPGDVYQLAILNFNMQLAKNATYAVTYPNFSYITQMTCTGTFYILIFNDLCIHLKCCNPH
jgi:hypothetical protein